MSEGKVEDHKEAQEERAKKRRQALSWIAAPIAAATALAAFIGLINWTPFWAAVALYYTARMAYARGKPLLFLLKRWKWGLIAVGTAALGILEGPDAFEWIVGWLRRYEVHTPWAFCWRIALEQLGVKIALSILLGVIDGVFRLGWMEDKRPDFRPTFPDIVFLAPILETAIFQTIPIGLLSWMGAVVRNAGCRFCRTIRACPLYEFHRIRLDRWKCRRRVSRLHLRLLAAVFP